MPNVARPVDPAPFAARSVGTRARPARWRGWVLHGVLIAALLLFTVTVSVKGLLVAALVLLAR